MFDLQWPLTTKKFWKRARSLSGKTDDPPLYRIALLAFEEGYLEEEPQVEDKIGPIFDKIEAQLQDEEN